MSLSSLYLDAFFACTQKGSFSAAAVQLNVTQSALSQRVSKLEEDLGTTLLVRKPGDLQLTAAGEELLRYCLAKNSLELETLSRIVGEKPGELSGTLRIGGFSSVMRSVILPALSPLLEAHPQVKLNLITKEINELPHLLRYGEIDYMIHYQDFTRDSTESLHLADEINVLVEKKGYKGENIFLDHDEHDDTTTRYLKMTKNKDKFSRRYLDDVYGLIDGVKIGLGRAIIPIHLVKNEKSLKIVNPTKVLNFPVILHFHKQPYYTKLHQQVLNTLKNEVPKILTKK